MVSTKLMLFIFSGAFNDMNESIKARKWTHGVSTNGVAASFKSVDRGYICIHMCIYIYIYIYICVCIIICSLIIGLGKCRYSIG